MKMSKLPKLVRRWLGNKKVPISTLNAIGKETKKMEFYWGLVCRIGDTCANLSNFFA